MRAISSHTDRLDPYRAGLELGEGLVAISPEVVFLFPSIDYEGSPDLLEGLYDGLVDPAPPGFRTGRLRRRDLLRGPIAIYAETEGEIEAIDPRYSERMIGVVATPGASFSATTMGSYCCMLRCPAEDLAGLAPLCELLLTWLERASFCAEDRLRLEGVLERAHAQNRTLRSAYESANAALADRLAALEEEVVRREEAEQILRQAEKMRALGQLAGGVAHDFNNLLGVIINATEMLQMTSTSQTQHDSCQMILEASDRATSLIKKMLAFGRRARGRSEAVDLDRVITDTVSMLQLSISKTIRVERELNVERPLVRGDPSLLANALLNLGLNAAHATGEHGSIHFSTTLPDAGSTEGEGRRVVVSVRDDGRGIAPEHIEHIFEPFFTTRESGEGTGLGLAAVYGIVQDHGGTVTVESEPGRGTVFHITLDLLVDGGDEAPAA